MTWCGNSPTRPPLAIRRGSRGGKRWYTTSPGFWGQWNSSASSLFEYMPAPIWTWPSPKSRRKHGSSRPGVSITRSMSCSCGQQVVRSRSFVNILIPCRPPRPWKRRSLASTPEAKHKLANSMKEETVQIRGVRKGQKVIHSSSRTCNTPRPAQSPQRQCEAPRKRCCGAFLGFDHGVGHPLRLLYDAKAPNCRKNKGSKDL